MTTVTAETFIGSHQALIDEKLSALFPDDDTLSKAARYALFSGGKRLRPLLTLAVQISYDKSADKAIIPACCLEMIHTYSLIHDDLPSIDNDDTRRGKPTLHKVHTEAEALLAGNYLLTYPFELLASCDLPEKKKTILIKTLSQAAGSQGMLGGQMLDINCPDNPSWDYLQKCYLGKTAALITAALQIGAICADAPLQDEQLLIKVGHNLGIAYQLIDDLLDHDAFLNIDEAKKLARSYFNTTLSLLSKLSVDPTLLIDMSKKLIDRSD